MGGPSPPSQPIPTSYGGQPNYIPTNQPGIDSSYNQLFSSLQGGANALSTLGTPALESYATNIENNPYASGAIGGAVQGSQYALGTQVPQLETAAANLTGLGTAGLAPAQQILQQGFDPQQALYQQGYQQTQDQANAINAMYGLGTSPAGAGLTQNALTNYGLQWGNNQLSREGQAATGYNTLAQGATGATGAGLGYYGQVPSTLTGATAIPYSTYNTLQTTPISGINQAAGTAGSLYAPTESALNSALGYLGQGTGASSAFDTAQNSAYTQALSAEQQSDAQYNGMLSGLGSLGGSAFNVASNPLSLFGSSLW